MRGLKALVGITILFIDVRFHIGIGNLAGPVMREYVLYNSDHGCRRLEQANLFAGKTLVFPTALSCCETSPASLVHFVFVRQVGVASFGSSSRCPLAIARQVRWLVSRRIRGSDQNGPRRLT